MTKITLSQALDIFSENTNEIREATISNMNANVAELKRPSATNYNLYWVQANIYLQMKQKITTHYQKVLRAIEIRNQPTREGQITDGDIERAKEYPIAQLLPESPVRNMARCPLHNERTPSFHIKKDNTFTCYGCQQYGDSIDLYQKLNNCTFLDAVKALTNNHV